MKTTSDLAAGARRWLKRAAGAGLLSFRLAVAAVPQPRPKVGKFGGYYGSKRYNAFRKEVQQALDRVRADPQSGPVVVLVDHVVPKPPTGKLDHPRGDTDNYAKATLDAITKAGNIWGDDAQVVGLLAFKRYANPGEPVGINVDLHFMES